jgi:hypothetical protein
MPELTGTRPRSWFTIEESLRRSDFLTEKLDLTESVVERKPTISSSGCGFVENSTAAHTQFEICGTQL